MPNSALRRQTVLASLLALLATTVAAQGVSWERSLDVALSAAADRQKVLFVAVVMPGERDSDALIEHHRDAGVARIARECVCFRVELGAARASEDVQTVLERYLGAKPLDPVVVPHHLVVHPDGRTVLSSAARRMTAGQLEWFVADGIRRFDPTFQWQPGDRARAPEGLRYGEDVDKAGLPPTPPPTAADVDAAIAELKKGGANWRGAIRHYTVLMRSSEPAAIKYVETQLKGGRGFMTGIALGTIAELSPTAWAPLLDDFLDDRNAGHREDAARGLAKMAQPKSQKALKKALKAEQEPMVRAWLLRAAVATAPADKATFAALEKALADDDAKVRLHAAAASGAIEDQATARRLLQRALTDQDPMVRSAAAYAMAATRRKEHAPAIEAALPREGDAEAKRWLQLALDTLRDEKDLREFRGFREEALGERLGPQQGRGGAGDAPDAGGAPGGRPGPGGG